MKKKKINSDKPLNCPNCGAPITGSQCEHCGTMFYDFAAIDLNFQKAQYLRLNIDGKILLMKAYCTQCEITQEPIYMDYRDCDGAMIAPLISRNTELKLSFILADEIERR